MNLLKKNETLGEILAGIGLWALLVLIIVFFIPGDKLVNISGLIIGTALAVFYIINLYSSIEASLELDEKGATLYTRKRYIFRYIIVAAVYVATAMTGIGSIYTCFAGIMGIKLGAYMQPFVRKYIFRRRDH